MQKTRQVIKIRMIVLLLVAWGLLVLGLGTPFYGAQDAPRVWIAASVRNYDTYGLEATGLMMTRDTAPTTAQALTFYSHHPPLIAWLPAALSIPFGFNELSVRYGFAAVTLLTTVLMYVLVRRLYGENVAFWAATFFTFPPIMIYYGRVAGFSQMTFLSGLLFAVVFVNWLKQPTRARLVALVVIAWVAVWSAWAAVFFVAALGLVGMFLGNRQQQIAIIGLGCVTVLSFVVLMGYYQLHWDQSIDSLLDAFSWRTSDASLRRGSESFGVLEFFWRIFLQAVSLITFGLLVLAAVGLVALRKHGTRFSNTILLGLFIAGMGYQLVFRNASFIHDYYKVFLMPAIAISAAMAIVYVRSHPKSHRVIRPVLDAQVLVAVVQTAILLVALHRSVNQPWLDTVIKTIDREATETDVIVAHYNTYAEQLGYLMVTEFYTVRNIRWGVEPEDVLAEVPPEGRLHYFYCDTIPVVPPDALSDFTFTVLDHRADGDHCLYYVLGPSQNEP